MTYLAELDDHPLEVRRGYAGNTLPFWPKIPGEGNVAILEDSDVTFAIYDPAGAAITTGTATTATVEDVTRVTIPVNAADTTRWTLREGYRCDITWSSADSVVHVETIRFACVREPYIPRLSLNDFVEEVSDAKQYLEGQAQAIEADRTAEQHASVLGVKAWIDVYRKLTARLSQDGRIYPRLIVDRWRVDHVVIAQALFRLFRAESGSERSQRLQEEWRAEADTRFGSLSDLKYDETEDGAADTEIKSPTSVKLRRTW